MMKDKQQLINQINHLLPQTQCGLCTYTGCKPYAEAIVNEGDQIDRCLPGGVTTLHALAELTDIDPTAMVASLQQRQRPAATAVIREDECIGCTKCIQACPVDAIIGAGKQMHTILSTECTGCELCVEPCPVDCIDIKTLPSPKYDKQRAQQRYQAKQTREQHKQQQKLEHYQQTTQPKAQVDATLAAKQASIAASVARAQQKQIRIWQHESDKS